MSTPVEIFGFIESGYPHVPYSGDRPHDSIFVDMPNENYDGMQGQRQIETQLETLVSLERLGFDGAALSEQHNGPAGLIPNVMLGAAWLAARTTDIKICVLGPLMNAYQSPIRLAEEIAAVDTMSRGRLVVGLPVGLGMSYHGLGLNPALARARWAEAHDLLIKALRDPGPFQWRGRFFDHEYVNLWPRPAHDIKFILPGGGSLETMQLAAKGRHSYQSQLNDRAMTIKILDRFRELCREEGYEPEPWQSQLIVSVHVSETDESARQEIENYTLWEYQNYLNTKSTDLMPPGYTSVNSIRAIRSQAWGADVRSITYGDVVENKWLIAGSPETVRAGLEELIEETGIGRLLISVDMGVKPRWLTDKALGLFAEQVLPHFRPTGVPLRVDEPQHGYRSALEYATKRRADLPPKPIVRDGWLVDADRYGFDPEGAKVREWAQVQA
jgi:alkanesulfonate monooxygenase SsuD/methylene tetrahydromethanopterin reductase-like flavin-dependent oxidoreductase (luciferase family)